MNRKWIILGSIVVVFTLIAASWSATQLRKNTPQRRQQTSQQSSEGIYKCKINTQAYGETINHHPAIMSYHFQITDEGYSTNNESAIVLNCDEDREGGRTGLHDQIIFHTITETIRFYEFALNKTIYLKRFSQNHMGYYIGE